MGEMMEDERSQRAVQAVALRNAIGTGDQPAYSPDGVDLTLIRHMLSLTPLERLLVLQRHVAAIKRFRDANPGL
jgi:hypothetical protein